MAPRQLDEDDFGIISTAALKYEQKMKELFANCSNFSLNKNGEMNESVCTQIADVPTVTTE